MVIWYLRWWWRFIYERSYSNPIYILCIKTGHIPNRWCTAYIHAISSTKKGVEYIIYHIYIDREITDKPGQIHRQCHRLPICFFQFVNQKQEPKEMRLWDELACLQIHGRIMWALSHGMWSLPSQDIGV